MSTAPHPTPPPSLHIVRRVARRRMPPWSAEEDAALRAGYQRGQAVILARQLGRTVFAVRQRAMDIGLAKSRRHAPWTPDEDRVLREYHGVLSVAAIGARLGRSQGSVKERVARLGLARASSAVSRYQRDQDTITRLQAENQRLRDRPALEPAYAPSDDVRRLAVLVGYRLGAISPAEAAVVLGVPVERLPVELGKAAKRGLDVVTQVLSGEGP